MTIPAAARIGPFTIVELIGSGGMGAVYRAHDPRLRRDVAIKVLPPACAADPSRLARFQQEALAVARLAHPNILAIFDIGTQDGGAPYLVAELLAGQTLRQRMSGRALPLRKALDYAIQIAGGLAAAHAAGVVHRDIKPENLFVTADGRVKILDFGIAKLVQPESADASDATATVQGLGPVGTAAYMSPEQARGERVDHRSDLFSLGLVIYEMLSGVAPFRRGTGAESMAAVLHEDPPDFTPHVSSPPALTRIVSHLLDKDPANRFQSARDLVFALEGIEAAHPSRDRREERPSRYLLPLLAAGLLAAGLAGGLLLGRSTGPSDGPRIAGVHRLTDWSGIEEFPAIAPDLKAVAFSARRDGHRQIFVRLLAGSTPLQITRGPADHELPRWSADATSIIYFSPAAPGDDQGTTWEIPALGGAPRRLVDSVGGCDPARDGRLACFRLAGGHIELIGASRDGSDVQVLTTFDQADYYRYPRWSPDGRWIAYQRGDGFRWSVFALQVSDAAIRQLTHEPLQVHGLAWLPDNSGLLVSSSQGATMPYLPTLRLWEIPIDGGDARPVGSADLSYLHPDLHASGAIVASRLRLAFDLWSYPVEGAPADNMARAVRITTQTGQVQTPTAGPGDREIAFLSDGGGHANLWVINRETGELRQITHERDSEVSIGVPIWSPDGRRIAFVSSRGNSGLVFGIWTVNPDGGNLKNLAPRGLGMTWSPDAEWIYYVDAGVVYKVHADGGGALQVRTGRVRNVIATHGGRLYFMIDRTLTDGSPGFEIHTAEPYDGPSRVLARVAAARAPQWQIIQPALSPDGAWLAMPLTDGETTNIWTLSTSTAEWRQVTDFGRRPIFIARRVSWSSDGRSILAAVGDGDADIVLLDRERSGR